VPGIRSLGRPPTAEVVGEDATPVGTGGHDVIEDSRGQLDPLAFDLDAAGADVYREAREAEWARRYVIVERAHVVAAFKVEGDIAGQLRTDLGRCSQNGESARLGASP
jgi:hypothetical protein